MDHKLQRQLNELTEAAILSDETAQRIINFYQEKERGKPNRLFTIFNVLGGLLSGLGLLLLIGHNWDTIPRNIRIVLAFIPLLIGQIACMYSLVKKKSPSWTESSTIFLTLAVGATISLVSQIYNIPGNLTDFLLVWILTSLPLTYVFRSHLAHILQLALITWYACDFGYFHTDQTPWWYLVVLVLMLPYYVKLQKKQPKSNIAEVLNWLIPLSTVITLGAFTKGDTLTFISYVALFGLCYNLGQLPLFKRQKMRRNGYALIGSIGTISILTLLTFEWFWQEAAKTTNDQLTAVLTVVLFVSTIGVLIYLRLKQQLKEFNLLQYSFLLMGLLYLTADLGPIHGMVITNLLVSAAGLLAVRKGIRNNSYSLLNYGLFILTILIICRFFDTDLDFIFRGIAFILVGAGFFFTNYLALKRQRKIEANAPSNT